MRKLTTVALSLLCATPAFAGNEKLLFSCTLQDNTPLTIKRLGDNYVYTQGSLTITNPVKSVLANKLSGIDDSGSGFTGTSLEFKQQGKSYVIGTSEGRGSKAPPHVEIGVWQKGDILDVYQCDDNKKIVTNFEKTL